MLVSIIFENSCQCALWKFHYLLFTIEIWIPTESQPENVGFWETCLELIEMLVVINICIKLERHQASNGYYYEVPNQQQIPH